MTENTRSTARKGFRKHLLALALAASFTAASGTQAATWDITINLTNGNHFTPLLVTAHDHDTHLFQVGMPATLSIEHMAECGHLAPLLLDIGGANASTIDNPVGGMLAPGANITTMLITDTTQTHLSIVSMVLPTNDAFLGLESQHIPSEAGTYTYYVNAYDAGTEANDEVLMTTGDCMYTDTGMIPGAPGMDAGMNGTGVATADSNTMIHVHRGVLGDQDSIAGNSDLDSTIHRWQNPVAKITVTVTP